MAWLRQIEWPAAAAVLDGEACAGDGRESIPAVFTERITWGDWGEAIMLERAYKHLRTGKRVQIRQAVRIARQQLSALNVSRLGALSIPGRKNPERRGSSTLVGVM